MKKSLLVIKSLLGYPLQKYQKFHNKTKIKGKIKKIIEKEDWPVQWTRFYFKDYPRLDKISLPTPKGPNISLKEALHKRRSSRDFSTKQLSLELISNLLHFSAGININFRRFYPSAGARYPLEIYIISINSDLPPGVYHYTPRTHMLDVLLQNKVDPNNFLTSVAPKNISCFIVFGAIFQRSTVKYDNRGYRHILSETGHLAQNFYLNCAAFDISCYSIGGYIDDRINELLDIDEIEESVLYLMALGHSEKMAK